MLKKFLLNLAIALSVVWIITSLISFFGNLAEFEVLAARYKAFYILQFLSAVAVLALACVSIYKAFISYKGFDTNEDLITMCVIIAGALIVFVNLYALILVIVNFASFADSAYDNFDSLRDALSRNIWLSVFGVIRDCATLAIGIGLRKARNTKFIKYIETKSF